MVNHRTKLKTLLRELFQFDAADLDFGIYRIVNQRRAEIDDFIENGLLDAVAQEFTLLQQGVVEEKREELNGLARQVRDTLGEDALDAEGNIVEAYAQIPLALRYVQKQEEVTRATVSVEAEVEIFNALYTFFSRYYDQGDFVTRRRYSRTHKYAVPYNGEEVLLHWANRDQFYVKTADVLNDYAFRIDSHGGYRVRFKIVAADTEQGNVKGDKRYFLSFAEDVAHYDETGRELTLFFEYRPLTEDESITCGRTRIQEKIIAAERDRLLAAVPDVTLRGLLATLPDGKDAPLLDIHLTRWTRKATSDYFIHKDLRTFLERELDFYLKNEVMRLDDLDTENAARAEQYLTKLVVIKRIARKIITFLAQIEDFQKSLFEKPKFVLASEWCVTLDRVPQALWSQVAANEDQWAEWGRLFGVQKPVGQDAISSYLAEHSMLTVDTALYDGAFKDALLAALSEREGGLDGQRDGLLIHGENFQALNLMTSKYRGQVKYIYIDPPYNTSEATFVYKNSFRHSSWVCMMNDRLRLGKGLLTDDGVIAVAIDDTETHHLRMLLDLVFLPSNRISTLAIEVNPAGQNIRPNVPALSHDYCHIYAKEADKTELLPRELTLEEKKQYIERDEKGFFLWDNLRRRGGNSRPTDRPNQWYPLYVDSSKRIVSVDSFEGAEEIWPIDPKREERIWRYNPDGARREIAAGEISVIEKAGRIEIVKKSRMPKGKKPKTLWKSAKYSATTYGTKLLGNLVGVNVFTYPKSLYLVQDCLRYWASKDALVLDFLAGSGTTGHAVINLNREDGGERKYILVEQGGYFDTALKPRIQKVVYAAEWKDGQPVEGSEGSSHAFQYMHLESYEDTLDNLDLDTKAAPAGLFPLERDDYLLRYFLDHETRRSRLSVEAFATPFDYQLRVRHDGVETRVSVDLVETANFLLGLTVHVRRAYEHQGRTYRAVFGMAGDQSVVVIWRDTAGLDLEAEAAFAQAEILAETEPDRVYINGDSHVPNAQPIATVFMNAMRGAATVRRGGN